MSKKARSHAGSRPLRAWQELGVVALAIGLTLAIRAPFFRVPLERDEGEYAYIAWLMDQGGLPYRDAVNQKPPVTFGLYWLTMKATGASPAAFRLTAGVFAGLATYLVWVLGLKLYGPKAGVLAAAVFAIISAEPGVLGQTANTEVFMLLPLVAAALVLSRPAPDRGPFWVLLCGLLCGLATMTKQVAAVNAMGVIPFLLYDRWKSGATVSVAESSATVPVAAPSGGAKLSVALADCGWFVLGLALGILPFFGAFWAAGALEDFLYWTLQHNLEYVGGGFDVYAAHRLGVQMGRMAPGNFIFWLFALVGLYDCVRRPSRGQALVCGWLATSGVAACAGWHFRAHYFLQVSPPVALWAGFGLWRAAAQVRRLALPWQRALAYAVLTVAALAPPLAANFRHLVSSPDAISRAIYGLNPFVEAPRIADYLAARTQPDQRVFILGSEPEILFHARRQSATRYIIFYPLTGPYKDVRKKQESVADELARNKPAYIVLMNLQTSLQRRHSTESFIFEHVRDLVRRDYQLDGFAMITGDGWRFVLGQKEVEADEKTLKESFPEISIFRRKAG
ncbi:MAG: hypothetical protein FJ272_07620 [Planctomycetes bacterium]|nr:hypothetical protein [Planctomycetota bacterium]